MLKRLLILILAVSLPPLVALGVSSSRFPVSSRVLDPAQGARIFQAQCSRCHTLDSGGSRYGPPLHKIGAWAGSRVPGMCSEEYIYTSIVMPGAYRQPGSVQIMPENVADQLSSADVLDLTAFLCLQGGTIRPARLLALADKVPLRRRRSVKTLDLSSLERGRDLFLHKLGCVECHSLSIYPGNTLKAPSLLEAGENSRDFLKESILRPVMARHATYRSVTLALRDGTLVSGRNLPAPQGFKKLLVIDAQGDAAIRSFTACELLAENEPCASPPAPPRSAMPAYDGIISHDAMEALLDFLSTLR
jgi:cytochrome c2